MSHVLTMQNIFLRQRGKQHARKHYLRLLGMAALVYAITYGLDWLLTLGGDLLMRQENAALAAAAASYDQFDNAANSAAMFDAMAALFLSPKYLLYNFAYLVIFSLTTAGMTLGHAHELLRAGKGEAPRVLGIFGRMRQCFKMLRLELWIGLKIVLWALPGFGVMFVSLIFIALEATIAGLLLLLGGYVLIFVLMIPAILRYSLGTYILADKPEQGVVECVRESKYLMQGHKWQYFKLGVPVMFKILGVLLAASLIGGLLLALVGMGENAAALQAVSFLATLSILFFYPEMNMTYTLFYLLRSDIARNAAQPKTGPNGTALPSAEEQPDAAPADDVVPNGEAPMEDAPIPEAGSTPE